MIGDLSAMPDFVRLPLEEAIAASANHHAFTLVVALNYGARQEVTRAAQRIAQEVAAGQLAPTAVDWAALEARLQTAGTPDPDLADFGPVKEWLHIVTQRMQTVFSQTNLYNTLSIVYGDLGVFGAPSYVIDGEIFWGQDRLDFVERALAR